MVPLAVAVQRAALKASCCGSITRLHLSPPQTLVHLIEPRPFPTCTALDFSPVTAFLSSSPSFQNPVPEALQPRFSSPDAHVCCLTNPPARLKFLTQQNPGGPHHLPQPRISRMTDLSSCLSYSYIRLYLCVSSAQCSEASATCQITVSSTLFPVPLLSSVCHVYHLHQVPKHETQPSDFLVCY